jgi:glycosyltransferase involved in cell wall biosynthesis
MQYRRFLKTVHIIDSMGMGGAQTSLATLLPELKKLGVQPRVAALAATRVQVPLENQIPLSFYPGNSTDSSARKEAWIRQECLGASLVHTQLTLATLLTRRALRRESLPMVTTLHGIWYGDSFVKSYPWPGRWKIRWMRWREKTTLTARTFLLADCQAVADAFRGYAALEPARIACVSNAIAAGFFALSRENRTTPVYPLVSVARLSPEKNQALILEALARIPQSRRPAVHFFGEGRDRQRLEQLARQYQIQASFHGIEADLATVFRQAGLFINASKIEGQPLVVLKALAAGMPCLLSDIPPHREMAADSAYYFSPFGPGECAQALEKAWGNPDFSNQLGAEGPARAAEARPDRVAFWLHDYYRRVLSGHVLSAMG